MWNDTTMEGGADHGNGWAGGEASFMTDKKADNKSTTLGDRLPVPATIAMLNEHFSSQDDKYVVGHYRFATVSTVGIVKDITQELNQFTYTLGDPENTYSEFVAIKFDTGNGFDPSAIVEGSRIRAIGKLKGFDGTKLITLFNIFPMPEDKDETMFYLEAKAARLFFEKNVIDHLRSEKLSSGFTGMLAPPKSRQSSQQSSQNSQVDTKERIYKTDAKPASEGSMADRIRAILQAAKGDKDEAGRGIDWIVDQLQETDKEKVRECLTELVDGGYIYSTTDDDTFSII